MCYIYRIPNDREEGLESCKRQCQPTLDKAKEEGRTSNYGCVSWRPLGESVTWQRQAATGLDIIGGQCSCDNYLLNLGMDIIVEALPAIGQVSHAICVLTSHQHDALDWLFSLDVVSQADS
jgi:hypothetical protein